jgi:hypothetical protein
LYTNVLPATRAACTSNFIFGKTAQLPSRKEVGLISELEEKRKIHVPAENQTLVDSHHTDWLSQLLFTAESVSNFNEAYGRAIFCLVHYS